MFTFHDEQVLNYSPAQLYDLVLDINSYPKFLPWCSGARIVEKHEGWLFADLVIQFKIFSERYGSKVSYGQSKDNYFIRVEAISGPFKHLTNSWEFIAIPDSMATKVVFNIDFAFKSSLLTKIAGPIFHQATTKMIGAFKQRAKDIYDY